MSRDSLWRSDRRPPAAERCDLNGAEPPEGGGRLRRELGLLRLTASALGIIIGAGIYVLLGPATAEAGALVWLSFLLAAVLGVLTGLSYAELSAMFPRAGGEFEYSRQAFPAPVAFTVGWLAAAALVVAAAAVSLGFARYLYSFVAVDQRLGAIGLITLVTLVALGGIERASRLTVAFSIIQVGGLLAVIIIGVPHLGQVDLLSGNGTSGVIAAAALIFFAFIGFDEVVTLAEETTNPRRTVPLALLLGLGLSTILYVGVALAAVSVLGSEALGASPRPLADVFAHAIGDRSARVVAAIALIATTNTTLVALTAASRVLYAMSTTGQLPARLGQVTARTGVPAVALIVAALGAAGFALSGNLTLAASVTDATVYFIFLAVNGAVIVLRYRRPEARRPFRSPISVGRLPVLPVLGLGTIALMLPELTPRALVLGAGLAVLGLGASRVFPPRPDPRPEEVPRGETRQ